MNTLSIVLGTGFTAVGFLFLSLMLKGVWLGVSSRRWPTTEGEVFDSRVEDKPTSTDPHSYRPKVLYRYRVNDREYVSENFSYGYLTSLEVVEEMVDRYPTGSQVQVHYHPRHPNWAVLEPGMTLKVCLIPLAIAAGLLAVGLSVLLGFVAPSGD
jgi:hypothetical protein